MHSPFWHLLAMLHSLMSASLNENQGKWKRKWLLCSTAIIRAGCFLNEQRWQTRTCCPLTESYRKLTTACSVFHPLGTLYVLRSCRLCLTLTELPVLSDHLAVAAVALTGIGAIAVNTAALPFTWVILTLIHICKGRQRKKYKTKKERSFNATLYCSSISSAETVHFPSLDFGAPLLYKHSSVMGLSPAECSRGCSQGLLREVRDHSTVAALWMACTLLSGITEQVNINKRIPFILARFIYQGFCAV